MLTIDDENVDILVSTINGNELSESGKKHSVKPANEKATVVGFG
jgi:hypothetical protein